MLELPLALLVNKVNCIEVKICFAVLILVGLRLFAKTKCAKTGSTAV